MFIDLMTDIPPIEFDPPSLNHPVSLDDRGEIATVADLIAAYAASDIRSQFQTLATIPSRRDRRIYPVRELSDAHMRYVTNEILRATSRNIRISTSAGDYSLDQLIKEVSNGSQRRLTDVVTQNPV